MPKINDSGTDTTPESDEESDTCSRGTSILEDARWQQFCRQVLSAHIERQIGLKVEPSNVRLVPHAEDLYEWKYPVEKAYLFRKALCEHGVNAFQELIRDVGCSILAAACDSHGTTVPLVNNDSCAQLVTHLIEETRRSHWEQYYAQEKLASNKDELGSKERQIQQLKSTLQHRNLQDQQHSKTLAWYANKLDVTDLGMRNIRNSLAALLYELDSLVAKRHNTV